MKVDDARTHFNFPMIAVAAVQDRPEVKGPESVSASTEAIDLSSDLRLADEAVRAAAPGPGVRPDAVARARALLASGNIAADLERLADRLIESLIESPDDH